VRAEMENQDWHKRTFAASSREQAKEADRLGPKGMRTGYGSVTWPYVNVAPPAFGKTKVYRGLSRMPGNLPVRFSGGKELKSSCATRCPCYFFKR